jgi:hypothetical protein
MARHSVLFLLLLLSFQLLITSSLCQTQLSDRDLPALIKIREQFGNPALFVGWRPGTTCVSWWPAACNEQGRVTKLFFRGNLPINSTLPPAIGELDMLETLSIMNIPGLHGPIPDSFDNLPHLSIFNIMVTGVSGKIPASTSPPSASPGTGSPARSPGRCRSCRTCPASTRPTTTSSGPSRRGRCEACPTARPPCVWTATGCPGRSR